MNREVFEVGSSWFSSELLQSLFLISTGGFATVIIP
jgi:hypothetical protein